jgi:ATP-dependent DNA helicase RecG
MGVIAEPTPFPLPELAQSLSSLPGVGPATAKAFAARDLRTLGDALFFFPLRYEDRRRLTPMEQLQEGCFAVVRAMVESAGRWGKKGKMYRVRLSDAGRDLDCIWFRFPRGFLDWIQKGQEVVAVGEVAKDNQGRQQMIHPEVYPAAEFDSGNPALGRVIPVYPQLEGVSPGRQRRIMGELISRVASRIPDPLFDLLPRDTYPLPAGQALAGAHQPPPETDPSDLEPHQSNWIRSLALNELFYFELGLALMRQHRRKDKARPLKSSGDLLRSYVDSLDFRLTPGQQEAVGAIRGDLSQPYPMGRLLCGDVGTGKTVVAAAAAVIAAEAGVQSALMAPTEVLARQHLHTMQGMLEPLGLKVALAVGSHNGAERRLAQQAASQGAHVVVGTHALFSEQLAFRDLGLVVIDEQHRFGVEQRLRLAAKGPKPHLLVLSATPIPRTLALALAGHLDISDLPQKPAGLKEVPTQVISFEERRRALDTLAKALEQGEQAYVVCPLVEESEVIEAQDAVQTHRRLSAFFPEVRVGLVHGRMEAAEQQAALDDFKAGRIKVLVSTTVVEVGVDVPSATLMIVLAAERFGLSQLHQLRGRVGRGEKPGLCLLVAGPSPGDLARQRLEVLAKTNDGLAVAEADLHLRGPGEALGARQAGLPPFRAARWERDAELVPLIRQIIKEWLQTDPDLSGPRRRLVHEECLRRWGRRLGLTEAG